MTAHRSLRRILAIDPISRGFGYVVLELPENRLLDWGVRHCGRKGTHVRRAVVHLLDVYVPSALHMEAPESGRSVLRRRTLRLYRSILETACNRRCNLRTVSCARTAAWARTYDGNAKKDVARVLMTCFPELRRSAPPERQPWQSEDTRTAIFDALALALCVIQSRRGKSPHDRYRSLDGMRVQR